MQTENGDGPGVFLLDEEPAYHAERALAVMGVFKRQVEQIPRPTPEEQAELFDLVRQGKEARVRLDELEVSQIDVEAAEIHELAGKYEKAEAAKNELLTRNLRFVRWFAAGPQCNLYREAGLNTADIVQEASLGFLRAVEKHNPELGAFPPFAIRGMHWAVQSALSRYSSVVNFPEDGRTSLKALRHSRATFEETQAREPTRAELAEQMGISVNEVEKILKVERLLAAESLEALMEEDDLDGPNSPVLLDRDQLLEAEAVADGIKELAGIDDSDLAQRCLEALKAADSRIHYVLMRHYGLDGRDCESFRDIGEALGLTGARIQQLEKEGREFLMHQFNKLKPHTIRLGE